MKIILAFVSLIFYNSAAAQNTKIKNIVFEGAGIRGIAYCGAIKELETKNILPTVQRVGGTSAGAITALLLSLNYTADEIANIVNSTSFKKFNDGHFFFLGGLHRLKKYYGWYRGNQFEKWLSQLIEDKTKDANISFAQLRQKGFKDLYVTGTCLNKQSLVIFSYESYPQMKVKDAVRISMSIPFYFEAIFIDTQGNIIPYPKNKTGLDVMIDGGFTGNFPIKIFDSTKYFNSMIPNKFSINHETIGFRIDSDAQIKNDDEKKGLASKPVNNINDYLAAFYNIILENLNRQTLTADDWKRTVSISDAMITPRIKKLSEKEIEALINNGQTAARNFFDK